MRRPHVVDIDRLVLVDLDVRHPGTVPAIEAAVQRALAATALGEAAESGLHAPVAREVAASVVSAAGAAK